MIRENFEQICKVNAKSLFADYKVTVKSLNKNELCIFFNNEGFVIEKTKHENSIKIFLHKKDKVDLMLRSFIILYGNEIEKEYFTKSYNKMFFDTKEDLIGILKFLRNKYENSMKFFFENDSMYKEIESNFNKLQNKQKLKNGLEETQKLIYESMLYAQKIRFSISILE